MHIKITGHHLDVTPAMRTFINEKFNKLERHFDQITSINVFLKVDKLKQIAEATLLFAKGELYATSESDVLYSAIDSLVDKLDRQLIKHKEKIQNTRKAP